jgi:hypothetical protein
MKNCLVTALFLCLAASGFAQVSRTSGLFQPGHYYTHSGDRVEGLLKHSFGATWGAAPDNYILFKPSPEAKESKLTVQELSAFVITQDSFTVKSDFDINDHDHFDRDFVRVVKSGPISLYLHFSTVTTPVRKNVLTYLVEKDGELYRMVRPANFNDQIPLLISDYKELLKKVKSKEYRFEDLQIIIAEYNQWHAQKAAKLK